MANLEKSVIISCGINGWYANGVRRLERSLIFEGWGGSILTWKDEYPPNSHNHNDIPYYFKIAAFDEALRHGFTQIMWCDASFWSVKNPTPIFDLIAEKGVYLFRSGYNLAQSVNDVALEATGISRDEAENIHEYASGCVALNFDNPDGKHLYEKWKELMEAGLSKGSRNHDGQSSDPRFLHHRQDQSCLSLAAHLLNIKPTLMYDAVAYKGTNYNPQELIFFIEGM
jgi:hypothetical protein